MYLFISVSCFLLLNSGLPFSVAPNKYMNSVDCCNVVHRIEEVGGIKLVFLAQKLPRIVMEFVCLQLSSPCPKL